MCFEQFWCRRFWKDVPKKFYFDSHTFKIFDITLKSKFLHFIKGGSFYKKAIHGITKHFSSKISMHSTSLSNVMHSYI
jgi:hypothetical protein